MDNRNFAIILVVVIVFLVIVSAVGFFYFLSPGSSDSMKNETFDNVVISVPSNVDFVKTDLNIYEDGLKGISVYLYTAGTDENFIDELIRSEPVLNNLTEINITNLSSNAKAFKWGQDENMTTIIVTNDEKNKAVFIVSVYDRDLAVKMANSVVFK
jgi:flagellar basal body-associated protein FliL